MRTITLVQCSATAVAMALATSAAQAQEAPKIQVSAQEAPADDADPSAEDQPEAEGTAIVVTGVRRSIEDAQSIRRQSDQIVDAIVAEDIGKLPDLTASASLARLPGVQVTRAAGEAADVQVRGLPDIATTYNGREIFTSFGRNVALQDFPAGGVAALEVYKASTANLIEGGIAGLINVRSRRPFDFKGIEAFGSISGVHFEESDEDMVNANLLLSNRWDTPIGEIGFLINGALAETKFLDSTREQADFIDQRTVNGQTFRFPDIQAVYFGQGDRVRPSVNGALQWRPTDDLEITIDGLFQGYRGRDFNRYRRLNLFGNPPFSNVIIGADGISAQQITVTNAPPPFGFSEFVNLDTNTYQFGGNIAYSSDRLRISGDLAYTDSSVTRDQTNVDSVLLGLGTFTSVFESGADKDGGPAFDLGGYDFLDPNNYLFDGLFEIAREERGESIQARVDLDYELDLGPLSNLQLGVRFSDRTSAVQEGVRFTFVGNRGIRFSNSAIPVSFEVSEPGFSFTDVIPLRSLVTPNRTSLWDNIGALRTFAGAPSTAPAFEDQRAFDATEKSYTGYAQVRYKFDIGFPVDGLIGLRAVKTDGEVTGTSRVLTRNPAPGGPDIVSFVPVTRGQDYTDYLPNITLRAEFIPNVQLRAAYTETRTRPLFGDLNPSANIDPPPSCQTNTDPADDANCFRTGGGGNPNLRPLMSTNYDLTLEYYFARAGALTASLFRRDVNGFISSAQVEFDDPEFGRLRFNAPDNGGDGRLQGLEVGFTGFLDFGWVPEWARAFGVQANYTYIDSGAELAPSLIANLPNTPGLFPGQPRLPGVSKHSYNLVGIYENELFAARLAYNYRGEYTEFYQRFFDPGAGRERVAPVMAEGRGVLDFSASVTPIRNVTIAFDATNLLADPIKTRREYNGAGASYTRQVRYLERTFGLTLRVRY